MTREEEARLVALLPCTKARDALLAAYMPIIRWMAHRIAAADRREDAIQDGAMGFLRSLDLYDPASGFRLTSYAHVAVSRAIRRGNIWDLRQSTGHGYIAIESGKVKPQRPLSLSAPVGTEDSARQTWQDLVADDDASAPFDDVETKADARAARMALRRVTHRLERASKCTPGLLRAVSSSLYWGEPSIREVAASYGVSHQAAHIHRRRILDEVRIEMEARNSPSAQDGDHAEDIHG
jgi:RNA polymerase sigma factor (sigma-70 family)